ncbi:hypothetical protein B0H16DRAFT_1457276 [Mycena metata]|uniref:Uncharacterized protein n=1 Tax=Mycena metata TaxID=1033252 RepID=A0AAD7NGD2_9AGAR|nr:hypothetical protein B0H16DRAFT_1457276 [Mycena metata]
MRQNVCCVPLHDVRIAQESDELEVLYRDSVIFFTVPAGVIASSSGKAAGSNGVWLSSKRDERREKGRGRREEEVAPRETHPDRVYRKLSLGRTTIASYDGSGTEPLPGRSYLRDNHRACGLHPLCCVECCFRAVACSSLDWDDTAFLFDEGSIEWLPGLPATSTDSSTSPQLRLAAELAQPTLHGESTNSESFMSDPTRPTAVCVSATQTTRAMVPFGTCDLFSVADHARTRFITA